MKIVGLITEYNPFHNGHKYHIERAKQVTGADYCIAVMSGDFVQRGTPAFLPKHLRAQMALANGCDLVIELPVRFSTGSAESFAYGAVSILDSFGCIDAICFGSECGDFSSLQKIAKTLVDEPEEYQFLLKNNLKRGVNFPQARQNALSEYFKNPKLDIILNEPNNILGIEYIKALLLRNSSMTGYTISRSGSSYHDTELSESNSSASAIRKFYSSGNDLDFTKLKSSVPETSLDILKNNYAIRYPVELDDFSILLRYRLLSETKESLLEYTDINLELANRIINMRNHFLSFSQFIELLKTKELTYSRISRCLIHVLLNIKKQEMNDAIYAHILGFRKNSSDLFSFIKKSTTIPVITKLTSFDMLNEGQAYNLSQDIYASNLYETVISDKFNTPFIHEFTKQIVKI